MNVSETLLVENRNKLSSNNSSINKSHYLMNFNKRRIGFPQDESSSISQILIGAKCSPSPIHNKI